MNYQPPSIADELEKLAELKEKKVITHEQFEAHKKALLNHSEVKKQAEPVEVPPKFQISAKAIFGVLLVIGLINGVYSLLTSPVHHAEPEQVPIDFNKICQSHFADVKTSIPELSGVSYTNGVCDSFASLNFNRIPADFDFIIRGNAATFSKLRLDYNLGGDVYVIGQLNGIQKMSCHAHNGRVDGCK